MFLYHTYVDSLILRLIFDTKPINNIGIGECSLHMASAYEHPDVVSAYLEGERAHGRVKGPISIAAHAPATTYVMLWIHNVCATYI